MLVYQIFIIPNYIYCLLSRRLYSCTMTDIPRPSVGIPKWRSIFVLSTITTKSRIRNSFKLFHTDPDAADGRRYDFTDPRAGTEFPSVFGKMINSKRLVDMSPLSRYFIHTRCTNCGQWRINRSRFDGGWWGRMI